MKFYQLQINFATINIVFGFSILLDLPLKFEKEATLTPERICHSQHKYNGAGLQVSASQ